MDVTSIPDYLYPQSSFINIIIGSIYFVTCITIISLTILMLLFYSKRPDKEKSIPYKYMRLMESFCLIQQVIHLLSSFFSIFLFRPPRIIENLLGALVMSSYMTCVSFMLFLTLNRFDVFYNQIFFPNISRDKIYIFCLIICYFELVTFFLIFMMPNYSLYYSLLDDAWHFGKTSSQWVIAYQLEYYTVTIQLCIAFCLYVLIIVKLFNLRSNKISRNSTNIRKADLKLLIPPTINFFLCLCLEFSWKYLYILINPSRYTSAMQNFIWILYSCNNTFVFLIMRREFRNEIKHLFCWKKDNTNDNKTIVRIPQVNRISRI